MEKEIPMTTSPSDQSQEECYRIAESMIEEIHLLCVPEGKARNAVAGWRGGYLKRKLLRQIRQAKRMAAVG